MSNHNPSPPDLSRQRKLDDLFGDEPFLSPTMKARRLNDVAPRPAPAGEAKTPSSPNATLLGLVPDVTDEDSAAFWRQRTGSDRPPIPADSEGILLPESDFVVPAETRLTIVETGARIDFGPVETAISAALSFDSHDPGRPAVRDPILSAPGFGAIEAQPEGFRREERISLRSAAAFLRAECPATVVTADMEPLRWFRADVLPRWLKYLPQREHNGVVEEH